jgi:ubiquinone/menaquinone biosynthesis C-methylase UbiE
VTKNADSSAPPRESIARFFDGMAVERNTIFDSNPVLDHEQQVRSRAVLELLAAAPGETVLDIGCGNARDIIPILRAGARIVGVDLSEGMIHEAGRDLEAAGYRDVELEVGDATQLKYAAASFDKVLCSEVIEHIPDADAAITEISRVLKPGGTLVISTPNRRSWYGWDRFLFTRLLRRPWNHPFDNWRTMGELRVLLERHGFEIRIAKTVCYLPGFLLTYRLPRVLQRLVVTAERPLEDLATRANVGFGYLNVAAAVRRTPIATQ